MYFIHKTQYVVSAMILTLMMFAIYGVSEYVYNLWIVVDNLGVINNGV